MNYTVVELPESTIMGPVIRTGNKDPECGRKIGDLWQTFMQEGLDKKIPQSVHEPYGCFGLYYHYDFETMDYDVMVGCQSEAANAPEKMELLTIPAGKYARFSVRGHVIDAVIKAWEEIWAMTDLAELRTYTVDFEAYHPSENPLETTIDLYVAIQ